MSRCAAALLDWLDSADFGTIRPDCTRLRSGGIEVLCLLPHGQKWPGFVQTRRPGRPLLPPGERTGRSSYSGPVQRPAVFAKVLFKQSVNDGSLGGKIFV